MIYGGLIPIITYAMHVQGSGLSTRTPLVTEAGEGNDILLENGLDYLDAEAPE